MSARVSLLYVCARASVLKQPKRVALFAIATAINAVGQGVVAGIAGALCRSLVGGKSPIALSPIGCAAIGLAAIAAKVVGGVMAAYEEARIAGEVGVELRGAVLERWLAGHLLRRLRQADHGPSSGVDRSDPQAGSDARGVAALTARVRDMESGLSHGLLGGARAIAQLIPLAIVLFFLAPKLAAFAFAALACFSLFLGGGRAAFKREQRRLVAQHDALLEGADEAIRHADLWRTYGAEKKVRATIASIGTAIAKHGARLEARATAWSGANEILGALALVLVLLAARAGIVGESSASSLLPFSVAFFLAYRPLRELAEARVAWTRAKVACEEIDAQGSSVRAIADDEASPNRVWTLERLELRGIVLSYGAQSPLTAGIEAGSIVAVVGANGVGKTTLLRTLLGLENLETGAISYGNARIDRMATGPNARPFAWVPQDAPLLADTLEANVALAGNLEAAKRAIEQMGLTALANEVGDARLGAAGRAVSGGERRAIAIARALSSELPVLLLDEPTAGLDKNAEARILETLSRLRGKRTVILVTHGLAPLEIADHVIRLGTDAERSSRVA